ncbi:MAG TPA: pyridoxamine 5'-phosphate oxidase family protein [Acidobacteriota bacterium]|nr:pyridoxamine 5'-phosphate oxidase family protein [Acidobacteriota bacterium]
MASPNNRQLVREIISSCRYLTLSTCDGAEPWAAPIEFLCDEELNFYFLSTTDCLHARHIDRNPQVALAIFDIDQPEYSPDLTAPLRGLQVRGSGSRVSVDKYPEGVAAAIDALNPPMPPYSVFKVTPSTFYLPRIVNGVNERVAVEMR